MTDAAPYSQAGTYKLVEVPIGIEAVKQCRKALTFLHDYQRRHQSIEWPSPKDDKGLKNLFKQFERSLVYGQMQTSADRNAHCVIRDLYKPGQLIRMLKILWLSASRTNLREMFSISARQHMLLQGQDMRNLNFADCFITIIPQQQHQGKQQTVGMVFCLDKGKALKEGEEILDRASRKHQFILGISCIH